MDLKKIASASYTYDEFNRKFMGLQQPSRIDNVPEFSGTYSGGPNWEEYALMLTIIAWISILIAILGIGGNLLTVVALARSPRARSASTAFIVSLCIADFLFSAINIPFSASRFFHRQWIHGDLLCRLLPYFRYCNVGLSLLSITAITVNRYILIVHQRLYESFYTRRNIWLTIAFTWLFPICVLAPTLVNWWGKFGYDPNIMSCSILEVNGKSPKTFLFVTAFFVPCVTIVVCYARIFWIVRKSRKQVLSHSSHSSPSSEAQLKEREAKRRLEEWRLTRMVLIIFCSFLVCYLPITIVKVADKDVKLLPFHLLSYTLIYLSACINPIIYGITNKQYRKAYLGTVLALWGGCSGCVSRTCGACYNCGVEDADRELSSNPSSTDPKPLAYSHAPASNDSSHSNVKL